MVNDKDEGDHLRRSSPSATSRSTRRSRARCRSSAVVTANPADPTAKNAYFLNGSQTSVLGAFGTYTKRFLPKVKTAAVVYPTEPGADTAAAAVRKGMQQVGVKVTMIGIPQLATDLLGPATQASSADMIVPALGFTDVRAVRAGARPDPLLEAGALDAALHVHSPGRVRERRPPEVDLRHRQTLVNLPGPQSKLYLKKGLQYGTTVPNMLYVFSEIAWEDAARDGEDHERDPVREAQPGDDQRRVQGLPGPADPGGAGDRLRQGVARQSRPPAATRRSSTTYLGKGKWKVASGWLKPPGAK